MHWNQYKAIFVEFLIITSCRLFVWAQAQPDTSETWLTAWLTATCNSQAQSLFWFHTYYILIYGTYGIDTQPVLKAMVWSRTAALNMSKIRNFTQEYDKLFCGRVPWNVICKCECSGLIHNLFPRVSRAVERIETGHVPPTSCKFHVSRLLARTFGLLGLLDLKRISGLADIIN
jgi:hypothetical protein